MGNSLSLPLVINTYLIGRYFETRQILFPIKTSPTNFSTQESLLPEPVVAMIPTKWWFQIHLYHGGVLAFLPYLLIYIFIHRFLILWVTFIVQVISILILLSCSNCPRPGHWKTLQLGSYVFSIKSHHFSTLPDSPIQKDQLQATSFFPCTSSVSSRSTGFYWRIFKRRFWS